MNSLWNIPQTVLWSIPEETRISWDRGVPYYVRVRDHFAVMVEAGTLTPGAKLPSERGLAEKFSITRVTVRRALLRMEAEGLMFREERRGWFVSPPRVRYDPTANTSFTKNITEQGREAGTTIPSKRQAGASRWESDQPDRAVGEPVFIIDRPRTVDGRAVLVEQIHVRAPRCPGLLDYPLARSMTGLMAEKFGIIEHRTQIKMRPAALSE